MVIHFRNGKLEKTFASENELTRTCGPEHAKVLVLRISQLRSARCLADLLLIPPLRAHELGADRKGQIPAHLWMNMEANYREYLARKRAVEKLEVDEEWLASLPVSAMQKAGWIPKAKDKRELVAAILSFFGCASVASWTEIWMSPKVAYRKSPKLERCHPAAQRRPDADCPNRPL